MGRPRGLMCGKRRRQPSQPVNTTRPLRLKSRDLSSGYSLGLMVLGVRLILPTDETGTTQ